MPASQDPLYSCLLVKKLDVLILWHQESSCSLSTGNIKLRTFSRTSFLLVSKMLWPADKDCIQSIKCTMHSKRPPRRHLLAAAVARLHCEPDAILTCPHPILQLSMLRLCTRKPTVQAPEPSVLAGEQIFDNCILQGLQQNCLQSVAVSRSMANGSNTL